MLLRLRGSLQALSSTPLGEATRYLWTLVSAMPEVPQQGVEAERCSAATDRMFSADSRHDRDGDRGHDDEADDEGGGHSPHPSLRAAALDVRSSSTTYLMRSEMPHAYDRSPRTTIGPPNCGRPGRPAATYDR